MTKKKQKQRPDGENGDGEGRRGSMRSPLHKLRKAWRRASEKERGEFLAEAGLAAAQADSVRSPADGERRMIANGRYLLPSTVTRIEAIMIRRGLAPGALMDELGFPGEGKDLVRALAKGRSLRLRVIASMDEWLTAQEAGTRMAGEKPQIDRK